MLRDDYFIYCLPLGRTQGEACLLHGAGRCPHGIFRNGDNRWERHDRQDHAAGKSRFADRQVECLLYERHDYHQAEETIDDRRNAREQFDDRFQEVACPLIRYFRHVDGNRNSERK